MINLFEHYSEKEKDLWCALKKSGYDNPTIVLNDNGYLPQAIHSPVRYFTEMDSVSENQSRKPMFFNEVPIPNFWEIKGDGQKAEIFDGYKKKGKILYSECKGDYRAVRAVEWFNDQEKIRTIDLYNQYGFLFGKESYSDGELTLTTYFNAKKQEVILFNHITKTIRVNFKGKKFVFESFIDFVLFYFELTSLEYTKIFYNSLATPLFIVEALQRKKPNEKYKHILFWQEESQEIPGNMWHLLKEINSSTKKIIIQNKEEYHRIKKQIKETTMLENKITYLGYLYNLVPRQTLQKSILIMTNSDQITNLEKLVKKLSNYQFYIAARTTMSNYLLSYDQFPNVTLYPTVEEEELQKLITNCSLYLDINSGNEVDKIIRRVFENNQLIFAFEDKVHDKRDINPKNIFDINQVEQMVQSIIKATSNFRKYQNELDEQRSIAGQSSVENYKEVLK